MYQTIETIDQMIELSEGYDETKHDHMLHRENISYDVDTCQMMVVEDAAIYDLSFDDWSLGQACARLNIPSAYLKRCPSDLLAHNMNYWTSNQEAGKWDSEWLVRADGDRIRGIQSGVYSPISNTEILKMGRSLLGDTPYKLVRPHITPDRVDLKLTVKDDPNRGDGGGNFAIGCYISNGEIGNRNIHIAPFIQRHSCTNSIVFGENAFVQRHAHIDVSWVEGLIAKTMGNAIKASAELMNTVIQAEIARIPSIADVVARVTDEYNLTQEVHDNILIGSEAQASHMGLVNGVAFAATNLEDYDDMVKLEELAGKILVNPDSVFARREMAMLYPNQ